VNIRHTEETRREAKHVIHRCKQCGFGLGEKLPDDVVAITCSDCTRRNSRSPEQLQKCSTTKVVGMRGRIIGYRWNDPFDAKEAA
jgi:hypothetical protein